MSTEPQYEYRVVNQWGAPYKRCGHRLSLERARHFQRMAEQVMPHKGPWRVQREPASWIDVGEGET